MEHDDGSESVTFVPKTDGTSLICIASDLTAGSGGICRRGDTGVSEDVDLNESALNDGVQRMIRMPTSVIQSLPLMPTPNSGPSSSSIHRAQLQALSVQTPTDDVSSVAEIPSLEFPGVIVEDPEISESRKPLASSLSSSSLPRNHRISDAEADGGVTVTYEPFCRICHLVGSSEVELMSPCRCSGSCQYVHRACLVVSGAQST